MTDMSAVENVVTLLLDELAVELDVAAAKAGRIDAVCPVEGLREARVLLEGAAEQVRAAAARSMIPAAGLG